MENYIQLLITLAIVVGGIVSAVNKSKRKAASQKASEQKNITRQTSGQGQHGRDGGQVSGKKSLAEMLRELAEEASGDTASPTVAPRPVATPSMYRSLAKSVSDRSVTSREPQRQDASYMPEAVAYEAESLEAEYDGVDGARRRYASDAMASSATAEIAAQEDTGASRLAALLGGEFDLRRAIIETEILTPKYL